MTTTELEVKLMYYFNFSQKSIVTNVTDMSGLVKFETDMIVLSKAGYAHGLELKISKSDLKAEFKNKKQHGNPPFGHLYSKEELLERYYNMFKYFSFAFPENLTQEALKIVPKHFGLYAVNKNKFLVNQIRKPKLLFNYKWTDFQQYDLLRLGNMRVYNLKRKSLKK